MEIQEMINGLLKLKKSYMRSQGCSIKTQQLNQQKANLIHEAIVILKQVQQEKGDI